MKRVLLYFTPLVMIAATTTASVVYADDPWSIVRDVLSSTRDIIVFDGVDQADNRSAETQTPLVGDWLVRHSLSDPTSMNPYPASDAAVSEIHAYVFEALLNQSPEPPFQSRGHVALYYPTISEDKLSYAFRLRDGVVFSDGVPLTSADVISASKSFFIQRSWLRLCAITTDPSLQPSAMVSTALSSIARNRISEML